MVEFRAVVGFPGYRVGNDGTIESCWQRYYPKGQGRGVKYAQGTTWRALRINITPTGYRDVQLYRERRSYHKTVHVVVLEAFVGPRPPDLEAFHLDNDKANNALSNLSWRTRSANQLHRRNFGTDGRGESQGNSKLKNSDVYQIFDHWNRGLNRTQIAELMGVNRSTIGRLLTGEAWPHLARPAQMRPIKSRSVSRERP